MRFKLTMIKRRIPRIFFTVMLYVVQSFAAAAEPITEPNKVAKPPLPPYTAQYTLYRGGKNIGVGTIRLKPVSESQWQFGTESSASVMFFSAQDQETSTFVWENGYPKPLQFEKRLTLPFKDRFTVQSFDWLAMKETGKNEKRQWQTDLLSGTHDIQTQVLSMQIDLLHGKKRFHYKVSKKGGLRDYHYTVVGTELLDTDIGKLKTIRVEREHDKEDDRQTITWFAQDHLYIPVRLQFFEDGEEEGDLRIKSIQSTTP